MTTYAANAALEAQVGAQSTAAGWRSAMVAALNNGATGPLLELRQSGVVRRRYQCAVMAEQGSGVRPASIISCSLSTDACDFTQAGWTMVFVQGTRELSRPIGAGEISANFAASYAGLAVAASFLIADPAIFAGGGGGGGGGTGGALTASSFTEVGRFKVPAVASGVNMTYANGGLALKSGGAEPEFYVLGNRAQSTEGYLVKCALIKAPATLAAPSVATVNSIPAATTLQVTADALDGSAATKMFSVNGLTHSGNGLNMLGIGYDQASEKLIISMAPFYGEAPANEYAGTVFARSANLTQTGTTQGPVKLGTEHPRRTPGPLVKIPTATATAWGVRPWASGGSAGLSVADTCAQGPNLHCFNPADITTAGATISTNVLANYYFTSDPNLRKTLSEAVGSIYDSIGNYSPAPGIIHSRKNDYWDWTSQLRGGPVFFESKQVVAFFGMVGIGRNSYRGDGTVTDPAMIWSAGGATAAAPVVVDDPANVVGNKPRGYPYKRRCIVVPYSEYQAVLANTKAPTDVVPSAVFDMPAHNLVLDKSQQGNQALPAGIEHLGYTVVGTALDTSVTPNRLYELYGGTDQLNGTFGDAIIRVYEVA